MKNITERLMQLDPTLELHNEGEWSKTEINYSAFNSGGVECEVGEFLYGLVRMIKPAQVLETGTHHGIGASYMGMALKDNGIGTLDTIEFIPEIHKIASERIERLELTNFVNCYLADARQFLPLPGVRYSLILLDTEPQTRFEEFVKFWDFLYDGGFIFIHDLNRHMHQIPNEEHGFAWPFGKIPGFIKQLVANNQAYPFHFSTPRGLTGFYKVARGDYKWRGGDGEDAL